jgi:hypothetical protein
LASSAPISSILTRGFLDRDRLVALLHDLAGAPDVVAPEASRRPFEAWAEATGAAHDIEVRKSP